MQHFAITPPGAANVPYGRPWQALFSGEESDLARARIPATHPVLRTAASLLAVCMALIACDSNPAALEEELDAAVEEELEPPEQARELHARLGFTYDGYRSGSFSVDETFVLAPEMADERSWGVTHYVPDYREQFLGAHYIHEGLIDYMWCWSPGGRVTEPGTRALECWFIPGYNSQTGEFADPMDYTSWTEGDRPGDGTGTVTFTSVTEERLAGTFSITMHVVDWHDWVGSPSISIPDGDFDLPVVGWDRVTGFSAASGAVSPVALPQRSIGSAVHRDNFHHLNPHSTLERIREGRPPR